MKAKTSKDDKLFAFLAVFLSIIGFFIVYIAKKDNEYVMFYAKQSLVIFILFVIASVIDKTPVIGFIIGPVFIVLSLILWIISWLNALSGEKRGTFLISEFSNKIKL